MTFEAKPKNSSFIWNALRGSAFSQKNRQNQYPGFYAKAVEEHLQSQKWKTSPAPRAFTCDGLERLSFCRIK